MARDVASGIDRHPDRTELYSDCRYRVSKAHPLFPYFLEKCLAIPSSPFFHLLVNGFSVTCFRTFFS